MAKCRIDNFRLRGAGTSGSMCHMFLLNVEFSNACRFRVFQCHFSTVSRFPFPRFQLPQDPVLTRTNIFAKHSKCRDKFFVLTMSVLCTLLGPISLLYKQLLQYTLLKSFTVDLPSALLTKFPKKFHMKLLASDIIFTNCPRKHADAAVLSIKG